MNNENIIQERPISIKIIGWIFIIISAIMFFSYIVALIEINSLVLDVVKISDIIKVFEQYNFKPFAKALGIVYFRNIKTIIWVLLLITVFVFVSGIQFIRLNEWARRSLEIICWLCLIYFVSVSVFVGLNIFGNYVRGFNLFAVFTTILPLVIYGPPTIIIIKFLRGTTIRNSMN